MNRPAQPILERPPARGERDLVRVASAIQSGWRRGAPPDAAAALAADDELAAARPLALELAYEEFCLREEAGEKVNPHSFADRFAFRTSLLRLIEIHGLLNHHPDILPRARPTVQHRPGDLVGDYEIVRPLGQGGFADVYLARDRSAGRRGVVLKFSARNEHEADTLGPLSHPHLMPVYSAPNIDGVRAVVMPYFGMSTLERLTVDSTKSRPKSGRDVLKLISSPSEPNDPPVTPSPPFGVRPGDSFETAVRTIAGGVASALEYLHARGVTHRDIKPANVLLGPTGHPYLLDFNLAADATGGERIGGTLPYLAPEVLAGLTSVESDAVIDWAKADVFSFGVLVFEVLTGRHPYLSGVPFRSEFGQLQQARAVLERQQLFFRTPHSRRFWSRGPTWRLIDRCLASNPADRPTAAKLAKAFAPPNPAAGWVVAAGVGVCLLTGLSYSMSGRTAIVQSAPMDDFSKGVAFYRDGQMDLAARAFDQAGQATNDGNAYACAAYCYARIEMFPVALQIVERARQYGQDHPRLSLVAAFSHFQSDDLTAARIECDRALRADSECHPARLIRALVELRDAQRMKRPIDLKARQDFETATTEIPVNKTHWLAGVKVYLTDTTPPCPNDLDKAVECVRQAVLRGATVAEIESNRALAAKLKQNKNYSTVLLESSRIPPPADQPLLGSPPF